MCIKFMALGERLCPQECAALKQPVRLLVPMPNPGGSDRHGDRDQQRPNIIESRQQRDGVCLVSVPQLGPLIFDRVPDLFMDTGLGT